MHAIFTPLYLSRLDQVVYNIDEEEAFLGKVPKEGTIQFDYVESKSTKNTEAGRFLAPSEVKVVALRRLLTKLEMGIRLNVLENVIHEYRFRLEQLALFEKIFPADRIADTAKMYAIIICHLVPVNSFHVASDSPMSWPWPMPGEAVLGPAVVRRVIDLVGPYWSFNPENPTGSYRLDMSTIYDHYLLLRLMELSSEENSERQAAGKMDASQLGNWECFRNVRFEPEPGAGLSKLGEVELNSNSTVLRASGVWQFDFQSYRRPPSEAAALTLGAFNDVKMTFIEVIQDTACRRTRRAKNETEQALENALYFIRWRLQGVWLTAKQIYSLICVYEAHTRSNQGKIELFTALWDLLLDEENLATVWRIFEAEDRRQLMTRMGHLVLFNPMDPDGPYRLDFSQREEAIVAQILIKLALEEPGDNALHQRYEDEAWDIPRSWLDHLPEEGVWEVTYRTCKGKRKDLRAKLAVQTLGWEGIEEVEEEVEVGAGVDLVNELNEVELRVMREKFELFDLDASGDIDRGELKQVVQELDTALSGLSFDPTDEQMDEIMAHYDADGDGTANPNRTVTRTVTPTPLQVL
jgi:hypothetical protein